jgi:hypothetical protein
LVGCGISTSLTRSVYAKFYSRSLLTIIRVFDESGAAIETHEEAGDFKGW